MTWETVPLPRQLRRQVQLPLPLVLDLELGPQEQRSWLLLQEQQALVQIQSLRRPRLLPLELLHSSEQLEHRVLQLLPPL